MNNIKLKATQNENALRHGFSNIDLADNDSSLGLFAMVFNDPDGSKGNRLVQCWNEHDELVRQRDELLSACKLAEEWLTGWASAEPYLSTIRALLAKIGGEDK